MNQVALAGAMDAHNTFEEPEVVKPVPIEVELKGGKLGLELPAKSVTVVTVR